MVRLFQTGVTLLPSVFVSFLFLLLAWRTFLQASVSPALCSSVLIREPVGSSSSVLGPTAMLSNSCVYKFRQTPLYLSLGRRDMSFLNFPLYSFGCISILFQHQHRPRQLFFYSSMSAWQIFSHPSCFNTGWVTTCHLTGGVVPLQQYRDMVKC